MTIYLLDTNIWLRVVQEESPQHQLAANALKILTDRGDRICLTSQNLVEFWSVATRSIQANGLGWTLEEVQTEVRRVLAQFLLLQDTSATITTWLALVTNYRIVGRRVYDTRLVAIMLEHNVSHILTFNVDDFRQFTEITVVDPGQFPGVEDKRT